MKTRRLFKTIGVGVVAAVLAGGAVSNVVSAPAVGAAGVYTQFPLSSAVTVPTGITLGSDDNLWVSEAAGNAIVRMTEAGSFTEFALPNQLSIPTSVTSGPDMNLWFTERDGNRIGRITTGGSITEFAVPSPSAGPLSIAAGPDGNLWFTESLVDKIGRITPAGVVTEFAIPTALAGVAGIAAGPDGNLWFTEVVAGRVGRITPTGVVTEFALADPNSQPTDIVAGPDGNLWFTERNGSKLGRITPLGVVTEFATPTVDAQPSGIIAGSDHLWFTESRANKLGRITTSGVVTEETIPFAAAGAADITVGPDDNIWFTQAALGSVARRRESSPTNAPPMVSIAANPNFAVEDGSDGAFVLSHDGATSEPLPVQFVVSGTASPGSDYSALGSAVIPAGQTSVTVPVHALADNVSDEGETVIVQLLQAPGYEVDGARFTSTVTITETKPEPACAAATVAPYTDRNLFDIFGADIDCVSGYKLAQGFKDGSYGPTLNVSRAQMATFVARLLVLAGVKFPPTLTDVFPGDSGGIPHELAINLLGSVGVWDGTTGEEGDVFGVSDPMRRDDMAQILNNAYKVITGTSLTPRTSSRFSDLSGSDNGNAINALAEAGVVRGKTPTTYEPASPVSRAQFAALFARYLQLLVDAGSITPLT